MKLKCLNCGQKFDDTISYDKLGWHSVCPECGSSFDVDVPTGKILMLFAGQNINWETFEDDHLKNEIYSYRAFNSVNSFMTAWRKIVEAPDSMWYWVIDDSNGVYICSGACDPYDKDIFKEYFGKLS